MVPVSERAGPKVSLPGSRMEAGTAAAMSSSRVPRPMVWSMDWTSESEGPMWRWLKAAVALMLGVLPVVLVVPAAITFAVAMFCSP